MKKDQLRLWTKQLSLSFWIVAPLVALVFGASGLSIALKNATASKQVTVAQVKSPYLYGQITNSVDLLSAVQAFWPSSGELRFKKEIPSYQKTVLVPLNFFPFVARIQTAIEKASRNLVGDNFGKHALGLVNDIWMVVGRSTGFIANKHTAIKLDIRQSWNRAGKVQYVLATPANTVQGNDFAKQNLFNNLLKKGTKLTNWYFSKMDGMARADGTDADFAWFFDPQTGTITFLNNIAFPADNFSVQITEATRFINWGTRAINFRSNWDRTFFSANS